MLSGSDGCSSLGEIGPLLGSDPDARYLSRAQTLEPGESLVLFTRGYLTPVDEDVRESDVARAAHVLGGLQAMRAEQQLTAVLRELTAHTSPGTRLGGRAARRLNRVTVSPRTATGHCMSARTCATTAGPRSAETYPPSNTLMTRPRVSFVTRLQ